MAWYWVGVRRRVAVPMPDGVILRADHYYPRSRGGRGKFPTILIRSPYGRGSDLPWPIDWLAGIMGRFAAAHGYHIVVQTARGCLDSGGIFQPIAQEAADGRATLDWIARQSWFNGALGLWGPSYLGYCQWAVAGDAPPYLKAMVPVVTGARVHSALAADGTFAMDLGLRWLLFMERQARAGRWGGLRFFWEGIPAIQARTLAPAFAHLPMIEADTRAVGRAVAYCREPLAHPSVDDPFWETWDSRPNVPGTTAAVHQISGWYDIFLRELLEDYAALRAAGRQPYLTIGPWPHVHPGVFLTSMRETRRWMQTHLQGRPARVRRAPVRVYVMGARRWRDLPDWPPPHRPTPLYLQGAGDLAWEPPGAVVPPDGYRYDPADPTPSVGGALIMPPAGAMDNRRLEARPDVLCYTTPPLAAPVEAIGPVTVELWVRSSLAHTDFFARLCDVYPGGRSINLCDGLIRVEPGVGSPGPDGALCLRWALWPTAYRWRRGHRIRVQISSGAHPRWSRNPGTGEPLVTATRLLAAEQTIFHDAGRPSAVWLPLPA
jgi:putative CocE/NonD family hydrolase